MPGLDGIAATPRSAASCPGTEVVALSGVLDDASVVDAAARRRDRLPAEGHRRDGAAPRDPRRGDRAGPASPEAAARLVREVHAPARPEALTAARRGAAAAGPGAGQQGDRPRAGHRAADGQDPRQQHPGQARACRAGPRPPCTPCGSAWSRSTRRPEMSGVLAVGRTWSAGRCAAGRPGRLPGSGLRLDPAAARARGGGLVVDGSLVTRGGGYPRACGRGTSPTTRSPRGACGTGRPVRRACSGWRAGARSGRRPGCVVAAVAALGTDPRRLEAAPDGASPAARAPEPGPRPQGGATPNASSWPGSCTTR